MTLSAERQPLITHLIGPAVVFNTTHTISLYDLKKIDPEILVNWLLVNGVKESKEDLLLAINMLRKP